MGPGSDRLVISAALVAALVLSPAFSASAAAAARARQRPPIPASSAPRETAVYYPNCDAARAAGVAPIYRGQPGYRPALDRDGDGIACEPFRGR